jgi:hypothetical protein
MEIILGIISFQRENILGWFVKPMKDLHFLSADSAKLIMPQHAMFSFKL